MLKSYVQNPIYIELQDISRFYQQINHDIVSTQNRLHRILQLTFPEIEGLFSATDSPHYWELLTIVPHAIITSRSRQALMDTIQGGISLHIGHERLRKLVDQLMSMGQISAPAVATNSYNVAQVIYYAKRLIELHGTKGDILTAMVDKAKDLPDNSFIKALQGFQIKQLCR